MKILLAHHTCQISKAEQPSNMEILWAHHICQISKADDTLSGEFLHLVSYNQRHLTGNPILLPTINGTYLVQVSPAAESPRSLSIYRSLLSTALKKLSLSKKLVQAHQIPQLQKYAQACTPLIHKATLYP